MSTGTDVTARTRSLAEQAVRLTAGSPFAAEAGGVLERLSGPLRVAIAGRVKAGKSTLLNALVGEKLAPTDAGECTRIVTWYREGIAYNVRALLRDGTYRDLPFSRNGALEVELAGLQASDIDQLDVAWPSSALHRTTLIDTPGLASLDDAVSQRTRQFLGVDEDRPSDADAVIYLMRHLHRRDADFLETFQDRSVAHVSPVNAVAVLSRADEIGAGRLDALESAARIATRYESDARMKALCSGVVPVAGLVAETGLTLQEQEAAALRQLAGLSDDDTELLLLSVERFCDPAISTVPAATRHQLLGRLGMFGVRFCLHQLRTGAASTASDLSRQLVEVSGLHRLRAVLELHFLPRASALKARSALTHLRSLARRLEDHDAAAARELAAAVEECEAGAHAFAEMRLVHLVLSGAVRFNPEEETELRRVTGSTIVADQVGLAPDAHPEAVQAAALAAVERWRARGENPMADPALKEACAIMARSFEGVYLAARQLAQAGG